MPRGTAPDERKQLGSRLPPELLKHLRVTAVERDTTVTDLVIKAVTNLIGHPKGDRDSAARTDRNRTRKKTDAGAKAAA